MASELIAELEKRVTEKLISKGVKGDLAIYCYTPKCVFDRKWDKYTRMARGLIVNLRTGEIVARPFPKFFNIGEVEETKTENLPMEEPEITEKLDGSLGILYKYSGKYFITTKGAFNSEQAAWATGYFREKFRDIRVPEGLTVLFEVVYPENRIVIDYGGVKELFLIGAVEIKTGRDYAYRELQELAKKIGFSIVAKRPLKIREIMEKIVELPGNQEGFVARYSNGMRIKIKGAEYLKIHRILSNLSLISIWEKLKHGGLDREFIEKIPEEFREWVEKTAGILLKTKARIEAEAVELLGKYGGGKDRKDFALWVGKQKAEHRPLLFFLYDRQKKRMDRQIFSMIRPDRNRYQPVHQVSPGDKGEERLERIIEENL